MTKNILLAATAVGVMAFAGAATATEISSASVSGQNLTTTGSAKTVFTIANESITSTAANLNTGAVTIASKIETGATPALFEPGAGGTNYSAVLTLTGAKFLAPVTGATLTGAGMNCAPGAVSVVSGGGVGQSSVTVVFNVPATCSTTVAADLAPNGVTFSAPFSIDASASTVSASVSYTNVTTGGQAYGGAAGTATLVQKAAGYSVAISSNTQAGTTVPTQLALGGTTAYTSLVANSAGVNDNIIGSTKVGLATAPSNAAGAVRADASGAALPAITYTLKVDGDFAVIKPGIEATDSAALTGAVGTGLTGSASSVSSAAGLSANQTIYAGISGSNTTQVTSPKTFTATVTSAVTGTAVKAPDPVTGSLETIGLQGTNFLAPWFALQASTSTSYLRLSNTGSLATGPITLTLRANNGGTVNTTCTLSQAVVEGGTLTPNGGLAANSQITVNGKTLANNCFGTTSTNSDILVTIQGSSTDLTAKVRLLGTDGSVTETSLGRLGDKTGVTF